jgi:hypothetical protein
MATSGRKVGVQREKDAVHLHVDGPKLSQNRSYKDLMDLMGWGDIPMPDLPMTTASAPSTVLSPSLFAQTYVPPYVSSRKSSLSAASMTGLPGAAPLSSRPPKRRGRDRHHHLSRDDESEGYPSSSSSSDLPSQGEVLAMIPEMAKAPSRFLGKRKTAVPTYTTAVWPREKACCVHACGDSSEATPSSSLYSAAVVVAVRSFWYHLTASDRRQFIANRIEDVHTGGDNPMRRYYLEPPEVISAGDLVLAAKPRVSSLCV